MAKAAAAATKIDGCSIVIGATSCIAMAAPLVYSIAGALVAVSFNYHKHNLRWAVWYVCASVSGGFMLTPLILGYLGVEDRLGWYFLGSFVAVPFLRVINSFDWKRLISVWTSSER